VARQEDLFAELAEHLEAAARVARTLARTGLDASAAERLPHEPVELKLSTDDWIRYARELHPSLGERQAQVLGEVAKAHPSGVGTGPIWRAIQYEQTNTYLALDALARHQLVRKDSSAKPHKYYLGRALIRHGVERHGDKEETHG
jgi:hypothetical protein